MFLCFTLLISRTLRFPFVNLIGFLSANAPGMLNTFRMAAQLTSVPTTPPDFVIYNLAEGVLCHITQVINVDAKQY